MVTIVKLLFVLILLYFAVQAGRNLLLAAREDQGGMLDDPFEPRRPRSERPRERGAQRRDRATAPKPPPYEDIEDAKWRDVE